MDLFAQVRKYVLRQEGDMKKMMDKYDQADWTSNPVKVAVIHRDIRLLRGLLMSGADPNNQKPLNAAPLHFAAAANLPDFVELLLCYGANPRALEGESLRTPLTLAAMEGNKGCVKLLLKSGADVNHVDKMSFTPLIHAVQRRHYNCAKLLLTAGAMVNCKEDVYGHTALTIASVNGDVKCVELLLQNGADVRSTNTLGISALHLSANQGYTDCSAMLLDKGADINAVDSCGTTALHRAATTGQLDCVGLLLDHNCDVEIKDVNGETALMMAAVEGHLGVVKLLVSRGANINTCNNMGESVLLCCARKVHFECVRFLLGNNAFMFP